jgi:hypothetical protein
VRFGFLPFAVVGDGQTLPFPTRLSLGNLNWTIESTTEYSAVFA